MTPEQIKIVMTFLERGNYNGKEFPTYATVMQALQNDLNAAATKGKTTTPAPKGKPDGRPAPSAPDKDQ